MLASPTTTLRGALALLTPALLALASAAAAIPATPPMTVYQFNGPLAVPYYSVDEFRRHGPKTAAGRLAQGTSVLPCLVIRDGRPLTDGSGTPYVGFEVIVDAQTATPASTALFTETAERRRALDVTDHHCPGSVRHVVDVRLLYALGKAPSFDPPLPATAPATPTGGGLDAIVRAFHASRHCAAANRLLMGRRQALRSAWSDFASESRGRWPAAAVERARHLDFVMRTALYEGHLGRGCNAYGACERNVIALSIRNRAVEKCQRGQGCRSPGDFEGVAAEVSQYNIWDEFLTQTSGLTSCFLRADLADRAHYAKLQAMYAQNAGDVERILFGGTADLGAVFPGSSLSQATRLRHYYHPPAMGKCFPHHKRLEYISGAVARRGDRFALIANTRISAGERRDGGYLFQLAKIDEERERDVVRLQDTYPGFVIDGRKVQLAGSTSCTPYGTPRGCRFDSIGRYRKTPSWLAAGEPLRLACAVQARGEDCKAPATRERVQVGGPCDTAMQPVAGVP